MSKLDSEEKEILKAFESAQLKRTEEAGYMSKLDRPLRRSLR